MTLLNKYQNFIFLFFYFTLSLIGILRHELWLDEAHHWLLARDSQTISELYNNTRSEGHPIFWNLILYIISRFTLDPIFMQLFHIIVSTITVYIFLKKSPFDLVFKTLFITSYFIFFEYNLISRNYILGVLFLFLAISIFNDRSNKSFLFFFYLAIASNIHLIFCIVAFALFLIFVFEKYNENQLLNKSYFNGYFIFLIGIYLIVVQIQSTNSEWLLSQYETLSFSEKITKGLSSLFKGLINIPDFTTIHFWNSNIIVNYYKRIAIILALLIYFLPLFIFFKNKKTLYFIYLCLLGLQIFFYVTQRGAIRFFGVTYIIFIISLWIESYFKEENSKLRTLIIDLKINLFKKKIIYSILFIQSLSGIYAYTMDICYPFTSAKLASDFLIKSKLNNEQIITITCDGTSLSPYLFRKVYFLCSNSYESYCHWDFSCAMNIKQETIKLLISNFMKTHKKAIFVSNYSITNLPKKNIWESIDKKTSFKLLEDFNENIINNSNYYIYEISNVEK